MVLEGMYLEGFKNDGMKYRFSVIQKYGYLPFCKLYGKLD
tara:strand:+ start:1085 stop:1204 length:120 start_codon:yes stop_codon:yes gene_type:complete